MSSRNCCFVIDYDFITFHHGCRRYLFGLANVVEQMGYECVFKVISNKRFSTIKFSDEFVRNNGYNTSTCIGSSRDEILDKITKNRRQIYSSPKIDTSGVTEVKDDCDQVYEICIFGGAWLFDGESSLPKAKKYCCVAYDIVPNRNYFADPNNIALLTIAHRIAKGYIFFTQQKNGLISITQTVEKQIVEYGLAQRSKIFTMPVFLPSGYEEPYESDVRIRKGIVLASPFDVRKGMNDIPKILNLSVVDRVCIFGRPRCDYDQLVNWFKTVEINNIEWWIDIDLQKQKELYSRAKVLLFPSYQEGLGLPILEAESCGASVLVRNKAPMNTLVPGMRNVVNSNDEFINKLEYLLRDDIDFSPENYNQADKFRINQPDILSFAKFLDL